MDRIAIYGCLVISRKSGVVMVNGHRTTQLEQVPSS